MLTKRLVLLAALTALFFSPILHGTESNDIRFGVEYEFSHEKLTSHPPIFGRPQPGGHIHIDFDSIIGLDKIDTSDPVHNKAQLLIIADSMSDLWQFAKIYQMRAIQKLSRAYQTVQSYSIDVNQPSLDDGLLQFKPNRDDRNLFTDTNFVKAIALARNSTYLDDGDTDFYFVLMDGAGGIGRFGPSVLHDIDTLDMKAKALVVFGWNAGDERSDNLQKRAGLKIVPQDLFAKLKIFQETFQHLQIVDLNDLWGCERILKK